MKGTFVVKIGGSTLGKHDTSLQDLVELQREGFRLIVVHGGASKVSEWLGRQGRSTEIVRGVRVTDEPALEMVAAVLAGLVNKQLVAAINSLGGRAVGLSGVDGNFLQGEIKEPELGYVGEIVKVNTQPLQALLEARFIPFIAPPCSKSPGEKTEVPFLNVNGDLISGEIALALKAEKLIFLTDVEGILDKQGKLIPNLFPEELKRLLNSGTLSGGMMPKTKAILRALEANCSVQIVDGRKPHALLAAVKDQAVGTKIYPAR